MYESPWHFTVYRENFAPILFSPFGSRVNLRLGQLNSIVRNSTKVDGKQGLNVLYQVCVFFLADWKYKMASLASDWLRCFPLLWIRWTEFNETWQEARSQHPLPTLCFLGWLVNKNGHPIGLVKKVAHCTRVYVVWPFGPLVLESNGISSCQHIEAAYDSAECIHCPNVGPTYERKRKRSDSVLWQKSLHPQKNKKSNVTTITKKKHHQKLRFHYDCRPT